MSTRTYTAQPPPRPPEIRDYPQARINDLLQTYPPIQHAAKEVEDGKENG